MIAYVHNRPRSVILIQDMKLNRLASIVAAIAMLSLAAGCGDKIEVYKAPKEKVAAAAPETAPPSGEPPPMPSIKWAALPEGWAEASGSAMRVANFTIKGTDGKQGAEMAVLPIPESSGLAETSLVSMWRQQLGMGEATQEELAKMTQPMEAGGATGKLYDIANGANESGDRILVGVVPDKGWMWFFKLSGRNVVVESQRETFTNFVKGIEFVPPQPRAPKPSAPATAGGGSSGRPQWKTPDHWEDLGAGMMQMAKYKADGEGGSTEISVSRLGGAAGGVAPNVNRWRGQLGLSSLGTAEANASAKPMGVPTGDAKLVDLAGDSKSMLVIMVSQGGATWFFKSMGPKAAVERERTAFVKFVRSVQYN